MIFFGVLKLKIIQKLILLYFTTYNSEKLFETNFSLFCSLFQKIFYIFAPDFNSRNKYEIIKNETVFLT
jgi:hypothetical protein